MTPDTRYRKTGGVVTRRISGETILVPVTGEIAAMDRIFLLSGIGHTVWDFLEGEPSAGELVDYVTGAFEVTRREAEEDLTLLLDDLVRAGLLREVA
jgi:hypothetical protein